MSKSWLIKNLTIALSVITLISAVGLIRLDALNQKTSDPAQFSWLNQAEVYILGVVMSVLAYPIYPEVAKEHLSLYVPNHGEPKRYNDDFFLKSSVVRDAIPKVTGDYQKDFRDWLPDFQPRLYKALEKRPDLGIWYE